MEEMLVTLNRQVSISRREVSLRIFTRHTLKPGDNLEVLVRWLIPLPGPAGGLTVEPAGLLKEGRAPVAAPVPHLRAFVTPCRWPMFW